MWVGVEGIGVGVVDIRGGVGVRVEGIGVGVVGIRGGVGVGSIWFWIVGVWVVGVWGGGSGVVVVRRFEILDVLNKEW